MLRFAVITFILAPAFANAESATDCNTACRNFLKQYNESRSASPSVAAPRSPATATFQPNAEFSSEDIFKKPIQKGLNIRGLEIQRDLRAIESLQNSGNIFK